MAGEAAGNGGEADAGVVGWKHYTKYGLLQCKEIVILDPKSVTIHSNVTFLLKTDVAFTAIAIEPYSNEFCAYCNTSLVLQ